MAARLVKNSSDLPFFLSHTHTHSLALFLALSLYYFNKTNTFVYCSRYIIPKRNGNKRRDRESWNAFDPLLVPAGLTCARTTIVNTNTNSTTRYQSVLDNINITTSCVTNIYKSNTIAPKDSANITCYT